MFDNILKLDNIWLRRLALIVSFPFVVLFVTVVVAIFSLPFNIGSALLETWNDWSVAINAWISVTTTHWNKQEEQS